MVFRIFEKEWAFMKGLHIKQKEIRLIRMVEVVHKTGYSRASIYKMIREGKFPPQCKIGLRAVAWTLSDVDDWIKARIDNQCL